MAQAVSSFNPKIQKTDRRKVKYHDENYFFSMKLFPWVRQCKYNMHFFYWKYCFFLHKPTFTSLCVKLRRYNHEQRNGSRDISCSMLDNYFM